MTVTHDFELLDACEDTSRWTPVGDGAVSLNTTNYIEGSGAINIYKPNTNTNVFGAKLNLSMIADMTQREVLVIYIYLSYSVRNIISKIYVKLYDNNDNTVVYGYHHVNTWGKWTPLIIHKRGTYIDWSNVVSVEIYFNTYNASQVVEEGDIVVDKILIGNGILVIYSTDVNPDSIDDVYIVSQKDNLMFVDKVNDYLYVVRGIVRIGFAGEVGALKISKKAVILDATHLTSFNEGVLWVSDNSYLIVEDSILLHVTKSWYPYGGAMFVGSHSIMRFSNTYLISTAPPFYGYAYRHDMALYELTMNDVLTNIMMWLFAPTVRNMNISGLFAVLPKGSVIFDDYGVNGMDITSTIYVFKNAEIVPRQSRNLRFYSVVFADGKIRSDSSIGILYNPVNIQRELIEVTGINSVVKVYYDSEITVLDNALNPISNATVSIYDRYGNKVFEDITDENGTVHASLLVFHKEKDSSGTIVVDEDYNPFTIEVIDTNGNIISKTIHYIYTKMKIIITPATAYKISAWIYKTPVDVNEPVEMFVQLMTINNVPIDNADISGTVIKPSNNTYNITFENIGNGLYRAIITDTSEVGRYEVLITASISNITISTKEIFDVGRIGLIYKEVEKLRKLIGNNMEIRDNKLIIYDDDGVTPIAIYELYDKYGNPTEFNVYKRVRKQ